MPGTIGKYQIVKTLGSGAFAKIKLAEDTETGQKVAIKIMDGKIDESMYEMV